MENRTGKYGIRIISKEGIPLSSRVGTGPIIERGYKKESRSSYNYMLRLPDEFTLERGRTTTPFHRERSSDNLTRDILCRSGSGVS